MDVKAEYCRILRTHEVQSGFMHEIIVRALDEMQLLGLQIEN